MKNSFLKFSVLLFILILHCEKGSPPEGIYPSSPEGEGPYVVFDPLRQPDAEIPLPNDFATRVDPSSPTKKRLNISVLSPTITEQTIRKHFDELDGFGLFAPISVSFSSAVDLKTVNDESVLLLNITDGSPNIGEFVPLDLGRGNYPIEMKPHNFYPHDPYANLTNMLLPEDNVIDIDGDGNKEFVEWYETSTNTLFIRPVIPLREGNQYAVILTKKIKGYGKNSSSIKSPFEYFHHISQGRDIERAIPYLKEKGVNVEDIGYAWTFTTQTISPFFKAIRDGLYGKGVFSYLEKEFPPQIFSVHSSDISFDGDGSKEKFPLDKRDNLYIIQAEYLQEILNVVLPIFAQGATINLSEIDYFVFGEFESPDFLTSTQDFVFNVNLHSGNAEYKRGKIPFLVSVPKEDKKHKPPYPVVLYAHGSNTSRLEIIMIANRLARFGLAGAAIDAVGHGPLIPEIFPLLKKFNVDEGLAKSVFLMLADYLFPEGSKGKENLSLEEMVELIYKVGIFKELSVYGRGRDENADGITLSGESFFVGNPFRQRDNIRQTVIDYIQFSRIIKNLSQKKVPSKIKMLKNATYDELKKNLIAGDFNADGVLDIGGEDSQITIMGTSLGGVHTVIITAVEPEIKASVPLVGGGGLVDAILRSTLRDPMKEIFLFALGPFIVGCKKDDTFYLSFNDDTEDCKKELIEEKSFDFITASNIYKIKIKNERSGEENEILFKKNEGFAISVESDKDDFLRILFFDKDENILKERLIPSKYNGLGIHRNSSDFRRNQFLFQIAVDSSDPVNFAQFIIREPIDGYPERNILQISALQDKTMPINAQISLARALGLFGLEEKKWKEINDFLIEKGVLEGSDYDVDDLDKNNNGIGPLPPVETESGKSAVRFANVGGDHEYMALPDPDAPFDWATYTQNQVLIYLKTLGGEIIDSTCIEDDKCEFLDKYY